MDVTVYQQGNSEGSFHIISNCWKETKKIIGATPAKRVIHGKTGLTNVYLFILEDIVKRAEGLQYLIVFEDDLEPSPDFLRYFKHFAPLLDKVIPTA